MTLTIKSAFKSLILAGAVSTAVSVSAPAQAGGLLADIFIKPFNPGLAKQLDRAHARMGRPLDQAFARGLDTYVPGAGTAWQLQDEYKRRFKRSRSTNSRALGRTITRSWNGARTVSRYAPRFKAAPRYAKRYTPRFAPRYKARPAPRYVKRYAPNRGYRYATQRRFYRR